MEITAEEREAIDTLKRLAKRWPSSLWLFSASGTLCVMQKRDGKCVLNGEGEGFDPDYCVEMIHEIENDGGDW